MIMIAVRFACAQLQSVLFQANKHNVTPVLDGRMDSARLQSEKANLNSTIAKMRMEINRLRETVKSLKVPKTAGIGMKIE
jgi:hypothetical protein